MRADRSPRSSAGFSSKTRDRIPCRQKNANPAQCLLTAGRCAGALREKNVTVSTASIARHHGARVVPLHPDRQVDARKQALARSVDRLDYSSGSPFGAIETGRRNSASMISRPVDDRCGLTGSTGYFRRARECEHRPATVRRQREQPRPRAAGCERPPRNKTITPWLPRLRPPRSALPD